MTHLDLLVVADPRLLPAEARSLAALVDAVAARGGSVGLVAVRGAFAGRNRRFAPAIRRRIATGRLSWIDDDARLDVRLVLGWHLAAFLHPADRRLDVAAAERALRLDHPAKLADGRAMYDAALVHASAEEFLAGRVTLRPTDAVVRASLPGELRRTCDAADLPPPVAGFGTAAPGGPVRVAGRHEAIGGLAWPQRRDELLQAYPDHGEVRLRLAGCAVPQALDGRAIPPTWEWSPDHGDAAATWLAGLDAWVLHAHETLHHPLTAAVAEALAAGRPLVGPPELRALAGEAVVATDPAGTAEVLAELPAHAGAAALDRARAELDAERIAAALLPRVGPPAAAPSRPSRARRRVLFLSPNGIGMGHLTRQLAVARRLPPSIEPVFLTMSQAVAVISEQGFIAEYTPYHTAYGGLADPWNTALAERLGEMIGFYDARLVLFDGNVPYQGLVAARKAFPERHWVWVRRGMWRANAGREAIARGRHFDVIVEPGEFAASYDQGLTAQRAGEALHVPPITLLDAAERLDRAAAREQLGLRADSTAVLVALGSGNNYDMASLRRDLLRHLASRADVEVVVASWLIAERDPDLPEGVRSLRTYPYASLLAAFDVAVSAVGYNSFHELIECGIPAVFVPNENPMMDDQERRGLWAERNGLGLLARASDPYRLRWAVDRLLRPEVRASMRASRPNLPACTGAAAVAELVEELCAGVQARRARDPLAGMLPRAT